MPTATKRIARPRIQPLRVTPRDAATRLSVAYEEVCRKVAEEIFTVIAPHGRGRGKNYWLMLDEIDVYATGGARAEELVREFRYKMGRLKRGQR